MERLAKQFGNIRWNSLEVMWVCNDNDTPCAQQGIARGLPLLEAPPKLHCKHSVIEKKILKAALVARVNALVDHHQFGGRCTTSC